jgi:hypothetical protein
MNEKVDSRRRPFVLLAIGVLAASAAIPAVSAADPDAPASAAASASVSLASTSVVDAGPVLKAFDAEPFPQEKSSTPKAAEWKEAEEVRLTNALPRSCRAYRLREWIKVHCSFVTSYITMLAGQRDGVAMFLDRSEWEGGPPQAGDLILPVRRGDRRMIEWGTFGDSYDGIGAAMVAFVISEQWVEGEPAPIFLGQ